MGLAPQKHNKGEHAIKLSFAEFCACHWGYISELYSINHSNRSIATMRYRVIIGLIVAFFSSLSFAETKDELMDELMEVTGFIGSLQLQEKAIKDSMTNAENAMLDDFINGLDYLPDDFKLNLIEAANKFERSTAELIDMAAVTKSYKDLLSPKVSEEDVRHVIEFYKSERGKRFVAANSAITPEWTSLMLSDMDAKMSMALKAYEEELISLLKELQNNE